MSTKDNQKVYFGDKKVSKEIKKDGVETIFTKVSENYDLMNDFMSAGMHRVWKRSFIDSANINKDDVCLDLAAGTGDIAKLIAKKVKEKSIYLCDQNLEMIEKAKERSLNEGFYHKCLFAVSSAEQLPYDDETFNHVFISFGFRNFSDKKKTIFIVEASSTFEQELGVKLGGAYSRNGERIGGTQGGSSVGAP